MWSYNLYCLLMLYRKSSYQPNNRIARRKVPIRTRKIEKASLNSRRKRSARRRAKRLKRGTKFTLQELTLHLQQFNNTCVYCQTQKPPLQKDHMIPLSRGGFHSVYNIVLACRRCNLSKGTREVMSWYEEQPFYCADYATDLGLLTLVVRNQHIKELKTQPMKSIPLDLRSSSN